MPKSVHSPNSRPFDYRIGSGNVFRDIGVPRPAEALAKAQLVVKIAEAIKKRHLTQKAAGALVGIDQPKISRLLNGDTTGFSIDRLIAILAALGNDVQIRISESAFDVGRVSVVSGSRLPAFSAFAASTIARSISKRKSTSAAASKHSKRKKSVTGPGRPKSAARKGANAGPKTRS
jgi:predicted XRE-type DNA-binding protein